jgi:MinD-like ATPase involved in chromosome partitioning or flagellar assembly
MLLVLWSSKGGSGTSTLAAACALVLARQGGARLADLEGDQAALFGMGDDPPTGLADWLAAGPEAPTEALERLAVEAAPGVALIPRGAPPRTLGPVATAEAGAALAVALRDGPVTTIVDAGNATAPAARALLETADVSVLVVRCCYLALRRAVRTPALARVAGVALMTEPARSLGRKEVADVLDRPILVEVPVRPGIARAVDAGVLAQRMPDVLARAASELLGRLGLLRARKRRAA